MLAAVLLCGPAGTSAAAEPSTWKAKVRPPVDGLQAVPEEELIRIGRRLQALASAAPAPAGKPVVTGREAAESLARSTALRDRRLRAERQRPEGWQVTWRPGGRTPAAIRAAPSTSRSAAEATRFRVTGAPAAAARRWLSAYRDLFALDDPRQDLRHVDTVRDGDGGLHVRFARHVDGIPVWGEELVLHLDAAGALTAFNGDYSGAPAGHRPVRSSRRRRRSRRPWRTSADARP